MSDFYFVLNSDVHFGKWNPNSDVITMNDYKEEAERRLETYIDNNPGKIEFFLMPGDLTEHGYSAKSLCMNVPEPHDEVQGLKQYLNKWDPKLPVYISAGNHDEYNAYPHAVHSLIVKRHGALEYTFKHKGVVFIGCHLYPDNITILKMRLWYYRKYPIVLFFHYAVEGEFSGPEWWSDKKKDELVKALSGYNIKAIIVGHRHETVQLDWRGYKVLMGAGTTIAVCKWDSDNQTINIAETI
uniref:Metallophosphoesterase n=1 Tax=Clandestinovirus TaxID=2831644 RepID=A0A8F8KLE9_9VIRU|nr:metallophosphoesterase [Clandestinovirus]